MTHKHHCPRLLIIGLDGCAFSVLDPLVADGQLPALADIYSAGRRQVLRSTIPPLTPVAWTSMLTGVNPGRHGVFGFLELDRQRKQARLLSGGDVRAPSVWQMLTAHDVRVGVFNVPWTYPPQPVNGFMISGFDAPAFDERMFHPPELFRELVERFGPYSLSSPPLAGRTFDLRGLIRQVQRRGDIASWLLDRFRPDVFMVVFTATDYAQHHLWGRTDLRCNIPDQPRDLVAFTYRLVDEQVRRLLDTHADGSTTVLVVSDHGARLLRAGVDVNFWLESHGLLARKRLRGSRRSLLRAVGRAGYRLVRWLPGVAEWARRWKVKASQGWVASLAEELDWERTSAVCVSEYGGVALLGDEQAALARLHDLLADLVDPSLGRPVFSGLVPSSEIYAGPYTDRAPQVWLQPTDWEYLVLTNWRRSFYLASQAGSAIVEPPFRAGHDRDGVVIVAGSRAGQAHLDAPADIHDIAATILSTLGFAPPAGLDGRPIVPPPPDAPTIHAQARLPQTSAAYSAEEQDAVEKRLRDLGYL